MIGRKKLKIKEEPEARASIVLLAETSNQSILAEWSANCSRHVFALALPGYKFPEELEKGYRTLASWRWGEAVIPAIRASALGIHALARSCGSGIQKSAFRSAGHAVATAHVKAHALISSDYALKAVQIAFANDPAKVREEREWQLGELRRLLQLS